jgi:DNA-binding transcriptional MerR regulator
MILITLVLMKINKELTKLYYSIGEVSEMFGVTNSLVRYWETEFTHLKPKKNRRGDRQFTVKDIGVIERIFTLVKERGFTLDGAKKEMRSKNDLNYIDHKQEVVSKLEVIKSRIKRLM